MISVLICTYNAQTFIKDTIKSILSQTYHDIEILILDNGSSDNTVKILKELQQKDDRINIFSKKENIGPYAGLNFLLDKAKGSYIAINDHDDIWHKDKLQKQVAFLERYSEYVGCGSAMINWYEKFHAYFYRKQPEKADVAWHTTLVFRNSRYRYDLSQRVGTDFYFIKNILSSNKKLIYNFPEPFVLRRIFKQSENLSGTWMKKMPLSEIITLNIGFMDKLALLNRRILPQEVVEWALIQLFGGKIPYEYSSYFDLK